MNMRDFFMLAGVGVLFTAAACADRFGNLGEIGGVAGEAQAESGGTTEETIPPGSGGQTDCRPASASSPECSDGSLGVPLYDSAGCPTGFACAEQQPSPGTTATCVTNGCWTNCAFVEGAGGSPSTQIVGSTSCDTRGSGGAQTTTVIGAATCITNGCWTLCAFADGGGGAPSTRVVGGTSCENAGIGGNLTSTTIVMSPSVNGSGGSTSGTRLNTTGT